jgi:hypothetical protein
LGLTLGVNAVNFDFLTRDKRKTCPYFKGVSFIETLNSLSHTVTYSKFSIFCLTKILSLSGKSNW